MSRLWARRDVAESGKRRSVLNHVKRLRIPYSSVGCLNPQYPGLANLSGSGFIGAIGLAQFHVTNKANTTNVERV